MNTTATLNTSNQLASARRQWRQVLALASAQHLLQQNNNKTGLDFTGSTEQKLQTKGKEDKKRGKREKGPPPTVAWQFGNAMRQLLISAIDLRSKNPITGISYFIKNISNVAGSYR